MSNKNTYETKAVVVTYAHATGLQEPEKTVLEILRDRLLNMRMLDIGVGGGRTTLHFASVVREYVGIDYSENMIEACTRRFVPLPRNVTFRVCDVREMDIFGDNCFDFVLFSYNGMDYISHEDRLKALREIKRVCTKGGFFCFSTHNLQCFNKLFSLRRAIGCKDWAKEIVRFVLLRCVNKGPNKLSNGGFAIINDGAHKFRLRTYYISPAEQIAQLVSLGFNNPRIFDLSGTEVNGERPLSSLTDSWLYYLCNV
jgi:SAM-dependent methyltransferase